MKVYLAGPDVFRPDVVEWAGSARAICRHYGYIRKKGEHLAKKFEVQATCEGIIVHSDQGSSAATTRRPASC